MARVRVNKVCCRCGKEFEHIHMCRNSKEGASYIQWAEETDMLCPDCREADYQAKKATEKAAQDAKVAEYIASFPADHPLPEITGVSEKQINYAASLRSKALAKMAEKKVPVPYLLSDPFRASLERLTPEKQEAVRKQAEAEDMELMAYVIKQCDANSKRRYDLPLSSMVTICTESNASKLIDAIRPYIW